MTHFIAFIAGGFTFLTIFDPEARQKAVELFNSMFRRKAVPPVEAPKTEPTKVEPPKA